MIGEISQVHDGRRACKRNDNGVFACSILLLFTSVYVGEDYSRAIIWPVTRRLVYGFCRLTFVPTSLAYVSSISVN